jgi:hypothetical protein
LEAAPDRRSPDFFDPRRDPYAEKAVPKAEPIKIRKKGPSGKSVAILASVAILGLLAAAAFFFFAKEGAMNSPKGTTAGRGAPLPDGTVLAGSSPQRVPKPGEATEANLVTDADNKNHLIFTKEQTTHHYRSNEKHGNILIITGRITNEYSDPRSFIKVKAILKNSKGTVVAEREAFAGNYLNEADLISLPMNEILTRLAIRGGQSSANINVAPGSSIPFMLVFDKLPDDLAEYVVEAVGSTPSGGMATGGLPGTPGSPGSPGDGAVS